MPHASGKIGSMALGPHQTAAGARSVLFVCMGNICRSPLAEGVFIGLAQQRGVLDSLRVDSAGTGGWHAGEPADARMRAVATSKGFQLASRARQIEPRSDFAFDLVLAADRSNLDHLIGLGSPPQRTILLRRFDPGSAGLSEDELDVPDPYYGGADGFEHVFDLVHAACEGLLDAMQLRKPNNDRIN